MHLLRGSYEAGFFLLCGLPTDRGDYTIFPQYADCPECLRRLKLESDEYRSRPFLRG